MLMSNASNILIFATKKVIIFDFNSKTNRLAPMASAKWDISKNYFDSNNIKNILGFQTAK